MLLVFLTLFQPSLNQAAQVETKMVTLLFVATLYVCAKMRPLPPIEDTIGVSDEPISYNAHSHPPNFGVGIFQNGGVSDKFNTGARCFASPKCAGKNR